MLKRIDHIELQVQDLEESAQIMERMGFRVHRRNPEHGPSIELVLPGPDQPIFELVEAHEGERLGVPHIAFRDEGDGVVETLKTAGLTLERERRFSKKTNRLVTNVEWPNKKGTGIYFQIIHYQEDAEPTRRGP